MLGTESSKTQPVSESVAARLRHNLGPVKPAISTERLEVHYRETLALSRVTMSVPAGSTLAVIGPNGSGKSTLLGALAGTIEPSSGSCYVDGSEPALVLQSTDVDRSLPITVWDTVALGRYASLGLFGRFKTADRDAIAYALKQMAIEDLANRQLHELSGGQRQRVFVAQGLAQETDVVLLDEPVNGLDLTSRAIILDVIDTEAAKGRTVVVTTHNLDDARRCDQVLLLDKTPIAFGLPSEVLTEDFLRQTFGRQFIRVGGHLILDDAHHHPH